MSVNLKLSNEQIKQFAYDWYDVIVQDIKELKKQEENTRKGGNLDKQDRKSA